MPIFRLRAQVPLLHRHPVASGRGRHARRAGAARGRSAALDDLLGIHPGWGYHAEELLHHTSRYYAHTEAFLRRLSGDACFSFGDYRAQRLTQTRKRAMARLLRRRPGHATARAVVALIQRLASGEEPAFRSAPRRPPYLPPLADSHPLRQAGMEYLSAADPFLNIAGRVGLGVRQRGRHLWVSFRALGSLLDAANPELRTATQRAIALLHEGGYHLHNYRRKAG